MLTEREKALIAYAFGVGKESGHHETVEGSFYGDGRPATHIESAADFIDDIVVADVQYAESIWSKYTG